MSSTSTITIKAVDKFSAVLDNAAKKFEEVADSGQKMAKRFESAGKGIEKFGKGLTAAVTVPLLAVGAGALKSAADMEQLTVSFQTMLGSAEKANDLMSELKKFSAGTPFQLNNLAQGTKRLLAFGVESEEVLDVMRMLGDTAQGDAQKLDSLGLAYGKAFAKGKASMEELNMIIDAGVPIIGTLAEQLGVSNEEIIKMASQGQISAQTLTESFQIMTSEGGMFFEGMLNQSQTLSGLFSTLKDNIALASAEIGNAIIETFNLKEVVTGMIQTIGNWVQKFKELTPEAQKTIVVVAAAAAAIGPLTVAVGVLIKAIGVWTTVVKGVGVAMSFLAANPIVLLVAAVAALAAFIIMNWDKIKEVSEKVFTAIGEFLTEFSEAMSLLFEETWNGISSFIQENFEQLKLFVTTTWETIKSFIASILSSISGTVSVVWNGIKGFISGVLSAISSVFSSAWEGYKSIIEGALNFIKGIIDTFLTFILGDFMEGWSSVESGIASVWQNIKDTISGIIEGIKAKVLGLIRKIKELISLIPGINAASGASGGGGVSGARANGGPVAANKTFLVGERGPELFTPNQSGMISPNGSFGGGITININGPVSSEEAAEEMMDVVVRRLQQHVKVV